jgi:hypothetical protein
VELQLSLPNPFNPTSYINDIFKYVDEKVHGLFNGLATTFQAMLTNPPKLQVVTLQDYLDGNSIGLATVIIYAVTIVTFVLVMFVQHRVRSLVRLGLTIVVLAVAEQVWFSFCNWLSDAGDQLANAAMFYQSPGSATPSGSDLLGLPVINNVFGSIIGISWLFFLGMIVVLTVVFSYTLISEVVRFAGLPALALSPLGDRAQKFLDWIITLGLVSMLFGRAAAVFCLELGKWAGDTLPEGTTSLGATFYLTVALILAIVMQFVLIVTTHNTWVNARTGQLFSTIRGRVESVNRNRRPVDVQSANAAHVRTMKAGQNSQNSRIRQAGTAVRKEAVKQGSVLVAGSKVAASTNPVAAAAVVIGLEHIKRLRTNRQTQNPAA